MKDKKTDDLFDLICESDYGDSDPVIMYNKKLNRKHSPGCVYFMEGTNVFHHVDQEAIDA